MSSSDEDGHTILLRFETLGEVSKALEAALGEPETRQGGLEAADDVHARRGAGAVDDEADRQRSKTTTTCRTSTRTSRSPTR